MITTIKGWKQINELGEANIEPFEYKITNHGDPITYEIYTDAGTILLKFFLLPEYITGIYFSYEDSDNKTNFHHQYKLMSTIVKIIKEVLNRYLWLEGIVFIPKPENNEQVINNKRQKLYSNYIQKHLGDYKLIEKVEKNYLFSYIVKPNVEITDLKHTNIKKILLKDIPK